MKQNYHWLQNISFLLSVFNYFYKSPTLDGWPGFWYDSEFHIVFWSVIFTETSWFERFPSRASRFRLRRDPGSFLNVSCKFNLRPTSCVLCPYFPVFGLNTEIYSINPCIHSKYRKIRTRNNSVFGHFSCSESYNFSFFSAQGFIKLLVEIGILGGIQDTNFSSCQIRGHLTF